MRVFEKANKMHDVLTITVAIFELIFTCLMPISMLLPFESSWRVDVMLWWDNFWSVRINVNVCFFMVYIQTRGMRVGGVRGRGASWEGPAWSAKKSFDFSLNLWQDKSTDDSNPNYKVSNLNSFVFFLHQCDEARTLDCSEEICYCNSFNLSIKLWSDSQHKEGETAVHDIQIGFLFFCSMISGTEQ